MIFDLLPGQGKDIAGGTVLHEVLICTLLLVGSPAMWGEGRNKVSLTLLSFPPTARFRSKSLHLRQLLGYVTASTQSMIAVETMQEHTHMDKSSRPAPNPEGVPHVQLAQSLPGLGASLLQSQPGLMCCPELGEGKRLTNAW